MKTCRICGGGKYHALGLCRSCYWKARYASPEGKAYIELRNSNPRVTALRKAYSQSPKRKAYSRAYEQSPKRKAYCRAYERSSAGKVRRATHYNSPNGKAWREAYKQRPDIIIRARMYSKRWKTTPKGKAWREAYNQAHLEEHRAYSRAYTKSKYASPEGRAYMHSRNISPKTKAINRIRNSLPDRKIYNKILRHGRRSLGWIVINPELMNEPEMHGHHIDNNHVLYIPQKLHTFIAHSLKKPETMDRINTLAYTWLLGGFVI